MRKYAGSSCKYKFAEKALSDLDSVLAYLSIDLCNSADAKDLLEEMESVLTRLCDFPEMFPEVRNPYVKTRGIRKGLIKNYVMYYAIRNEEIIVLRIVYSKRNLEDILEEMKDRL